MTSLLYCSLLSLPTNVSGMDYCYDPNAPLDKPLLDETPPATIAPEETKTGCSAEVLACPGGGIVFQDPLNNCEFKPCPNTETPSTPAALTATTTTTTTTTSGLDTSSFYCGYNIGQVNNNCANAQSCPTGENSVCPGLEVCIRNTVCGSSPTTTTAAEGENTPSATSAATITTMTTVTTTEGGSSNEPTTCDNLCIDALPSAFCPQVLDLPNCLEIKVGEVCESDGECATDEKLNNCGTFDVYVRVECGGATPTQGELMNMPVTVAATEPTTVMTTTSIAAISTVPPVATVSVAEKIDLNITSEGDMTANMMMAPVPTLPSIESFDTDTSTNIISSEPPIVASTPPVSEFSSSAAAGFNYDRNPDGEVSAVPGDQSSAGFFTSYDPSQESSTMASTTPEHDKWDLNAYFSSSLSTTSSSATITSITMLLGLLTTTLAFSLI